MADTSNSPVEGKALTPEQKTDLLHRLARIEGQLRGIQRLLSQAEVPSDCDAVAQQMAAARKALDRAFVTLLTSAITTHTSTAKSMEEASIRAKTLAEMFGKFA
ncbi:MAG: metal-sensitive transcriptional repressor family protein [Paucimonas sp.]|jgi:DNA-binding FrmR family transcriptional regulator|nr:metal-sensitive transcriptional repressor family protein [Paucimonas sp.]